MGIMQQCKVTKSLAIVVYHERNRRNVSDSLNCVELFGMMGLL